MTMDRRGQDPPDYADHAFDGAVMGRPSDLERQQRVQERARRRAQRGASRAQQTRNRPPSPPLSPVRARSTRRARSRNRHRGPNWKLLRRVVLAFVVVIVLLEGVSYVQFMSQPSSSPFGVRSVEWVRGHVSSWLVDEIEREYYSLNAPAKGGPPLTTLPAVGMGSAKLSQLAASQLPPRITPLISPVLPGEGIWRTSGLNVSGGPAVLVTTFRSDPTYPRMVAGVAWVDQRKAQVVLLPGRYEPPGTGPRGAMQVPTNMRSQLLATFNSGFRLEDMTGGEFANGYLWRPLVKGMATAVGYKNGLMDIVDWTGGPTPGPDVAFARQNLPLIVDNGKPNPNLSDSPVWGATLGNAVRVWRSGLGIDKNGNLIYAAADQQTVGSLAQILIHAGAVRAMETDINYEWVTFISYAAPNGGLSSKLLSGIDHGGTRYLTPDDRDFFAVVARAPVTPSNG
jgi:hypothetical protein